MYRTRYDPTHPRADITGFVGEHVLIAEEMLGRPLEKGEIVHHCDFRKYNNSQDNLLIMTRQEHQQLPAFQAQFIILKGLYAEFLEWWRERKDMTDELEQAQKRLLNLEERKNRLEQKLNRRSK